MEGNIVTLPSGMEVEEVEQKAKVKWYLKTFLVEKNGNSNEITITKISNNQEVIKKPFYAII